MRNFLAGVIVIDGIVSLFGKTYPKLTTRDGKTVLLVTEDITQIRED